MTGILEGLVAQAESQGAARVTLQAIVNVVKIIECH